MKMHDRLGAELEYMLVMYVGKCSEIYSSYKRNNAMSIRSLVGNVNRVAQLG
jgi:hypothetical protein